MIYETSIVLTTVRVVWFEIIKVDIGFALFYNTRAHYEKSIFNDLKPL